VTEVAGITAVDSFFEYLGLESAGRLAALFDLIRLPVLVALGSAAYVTARSVDRGELSHIVLYLFYVVLITFFIGPAEVRMPALEGDRVIESPRAVVQLNQICDTVLAAASGRLKTLKEELERDQASFVIRHVRITDAGLVGASRLYLAECLGPELAARSARGEDVTVHLQNPFLVQSFASPQSSAGGCLEARRELLEGIREHLWAKEHVRRALAGGGGWMAKFVMKNIPVSEYLCGIALAREAASLYSDHQQAEASTGRNALIERRAGTLSIWEAVRGLSYGLDIPHEAFSFVSSEMELRSQRYEVMRQAPKFYGIALMLLIAGFPIAGVLAILPGGWRALANWGKLFLSVKLWPLFWNLLYSYSSLSADFDARLVLPSIYLMIPAVSFMFVQLVAGAAVSPFRTAGERNGAARPEALMGQVAGMVR
jgi:hypothetical protein